MKLLLRGCCFLLVLLLQSDAASAQDTAASPPHVPRQGANLIVNPSVNTKANWSYLRDAEYDASTSRTDDGSGSMKLVTPPPSMALTELIAVQSGKRYTYGFYIKTLNGPTYVVRRSVCTTVIASSSATTPRDEAARRGTVNGRSMPCRSSCPKA